MKLRSTIALFALCWAAEAHADQFSAGSLIIPMDECYQYDGLSQYTRQGWNQGEPYGTAYSSATACVWLDNTTTPNTVNDPYDGACLAGSAYPASPTGIQHAFGALYLLASRNIPVMVALRANKEALGDYDFYVSSPDGTNNAVFYLKFSAGTYSSLELGGLATSTAGKNIYYRGAPFIIPAAYAQQAISVLQAGPTMFNDVLIHVARTDFTAPVSGVIQTTPKPVGIVNYSNSNGYNKGLKYLSDSGITSIPGLTAYVKMTLKTGGNGAVNAINYSWTGAANSSPCNGSGACTGLVYASNNQRVIDVVWAPDINQTTCQDVLTNPNCFDSNGICLPDTCSAMGASSWCCGVSSCGTGSCFNFTNADGTTQTYECPCPNAGAGNSNDLCAIANWQFNVAVQNEPQCYSVNALGNSPSTGCSTSNSVPANICNISSQHCLLACSTNACPNGMTCVTKTDAPQSGCGGGSTQCPTGYTCSGGACSAKVCVPADASGSCSPACASDEYCDTTNPIDCSTGSPVCRNGGSASCSSGSPQCSSGLPACGSNMPAPTCPASTGVCRPKWGCGVTCSNCPNSQKNTNVWGNLASNYLNSFLQAGGRVLGTDSTALTAETASQNWLTTGGLGYTSGALNGSATSSFCAASASTATNGPGTPQSSSTDFPASDVEIQIGDFLYKALGGNSPSYTVAGSSVLRPGVHGIGYQSGSSWIWPAIVGTPYVTGTPVTTGGRVIYEGANNYGSSSSSAPLVKLAGQHIIFDTLLNAAGNAPGSPTNQIYGAEISRSSPVANPLGQWYLGSLDWGYTADTLGTGNNGYTVANGTYPYGDGHFREFKNALDYSPGSDTNFDIKQACSRSSTASPCNWDGYDYIFNSANPRSIYMAYKNGGTWTLVPFTGSNDTQIAQTMFNVSTPAPAEKTCAQALVNKIVNTHKLGGVDYDTPAVIEESHGLVTGNGLTRPTIAYVGARDGMLHAFCAKAKTASDGSVGTQTSPGLCYGRDPGTEMWAIIPAAVMREFGAAVGRNCTSALLGTADYSKINVGGTMRVGDVFDLYPGGTNKQWKTVLLYGTRKSGGGAVGAIDISDPNPSNVNTAGLQMLWENSNLNTSPPMGYTNGATLVAPTVTATALVTSSNCVSGAGTTCPVGSTPGISAYLFKIGTGATITSATTTYTRSVPTSTLLKVPNEAPALPTVLDTDGDSFDDTALATDFEGRVFRFAFTGSTFSAPTVIFNASSWYNGVNGTACPANTACQPISTSISIVRRLAGSPQYIGLFGTGGASWTSTASGIDYKIYGVDVTGSQTTPFLTLSPGTAATPLGTFPLRIYGAPTISGSDVFTNVTTLSIDNNNQMMLPYQHPAGVNQMWGAAVRWPVGTSPTLGYAAGAANETFTYSSSSYSGSTSPVYTGSMATPTGAVTQSVTFVGGGKAERHDLTSDTTSQRNAALAIVPGGTRNFSVLAWFGLD